MCVTGRPFEDYKDGWTWLCKITLAALQISGRDLRTLIEETTWSAERDLAKSRENMNAEVMIQILNDSKNGGSEYVNQM